MEAQRKREGSHINKSLLYLGNVIQKLSGKEGNHSHIPYRESKLTRILQNALGGNSRTAIVANISPAPANIAATRSTLEFAQRAKQIKNNAKINEVQDWKLLYMQTQELLRREREEGAKLWQDRINAMEAEMGTLREELDTERAHKAQLLQDSQRAQNEFYIMIKDIDDKVTSLESYIASLEGALQEARATIESNAAEAKQREEQLKQEHEREVFLMEERHVNELDALKAQEQRLIEQQRQHQQQHEADEETLRRKLEDRMALDRARWVAERQQLLEQVKQGEDKYQRLVQQVAELEEAFGTAIANMRLMKLKKNKHKHKHHKSKLLHQP
eukprot:GEZU01026572.1.p1 GENE.GEZU01026572.1~~GEZU01026572.1.p1  ORF type:complete len:330 (-),score=128.19 GEZU01026572.1:353-1342(-)